MSFYRRTNHKAGFCLFRPKKRPLRFALSPVFVAPARLDFRDMCLPSDDQGHTPECAAFATAGFIEMNNWRLTHFPKQVDADAIYKKAKLIDGDGQDGTTLESAAQAAIALGMIKATPSFLSDNHPDTLKYAIHTHSGAIIGMNITDEWNSVGSDGKLEIRPDAEVLGGHGIYACMYDGYGPGIQNSWGLSYGLGGFIQMSWAQYQAQWMDGCVPILQSEVNAANDIFVALNNNTNEVIV